MSVRRAVLVTATEPEPRRYGKPVVLGGILDHLCDRLGPENVHVILIGRGGVDRPPVPYRRNVLLKPGTVEQARSGLLKVALPSRGGRRSIQEAVLHSTRLAAGIADLVRGIDPDLEIWDTVRMGQYVLDPALAGRRPARRILYADDLFSERYAAMLENQGDVGNPGGEFVKLLPGPAKALLADPRVHRPLLKLEKNLVAASEDRQPVHFDATYLISAAEAGRLAARVPGATVGVLPPRLREPAPLERRFDGRPEFTFLGGFDYAPNVDGLDWFLTRARSAVQAALPGVTVNVVGAGTERGLASAAPWGDAVRFLGWVDDLNAVLARSAALLSPLTTGSGVKIKVLEALARGLPVVATPAGVQGVEGTDGCLVGATPDELAAAMAQAADTVVNAELSTAARKSWERSYAPAVIGRRYDEIFGTGPA